MGILGYMLLVICVVYFVLYEPITAYNSTHNIFCAIAYGLATAIAGFVVFVFVMFASTLGPSGDWKVSEENCKKVEVYSIGLHSGIHGDFMLGCGTVKDEPVYYFYTRENEGFTLKHVSAEKATIVETDSIRPQIKYLAEEFTGERTAFKWLMFGTHDEKWRVKGGGEYWNKGIIIYVPKGSVIQSYTLVP